MRRVDVADARELLRGQAGRSGERLVLDPLEGRFVESGDAEDLGYSSLLA